MAEAERDGEIPGVLLEPACVANHEGGAIGPKEELAWVASAAEGRASEPVSSAEGSAPELVLLVLFTQLTRY